MARPGHVELDAQDKPLQPGRQLTETQHIAKSANLIHVDRLSLDDFFLHDVDSESFRFTQEAIKDLAPAGPFALDGERTNT